MKHIFLYILLFLFAPMVHAQEAEMQEEEDIMQKNSKRPYGLYIFNDQLKEVFPKAKTNYIGQKVAKHMEKIYKPFSDKEGYLIVGRRFLPSEEDLTAILSYARRGNDVMICASMFSDLAKSAFKISTALDIDVENKISITHPDLVTTPLSSAFLYVDKNYFSDYSYESTVLGRNADGTANFLRIKKGDGNIYLHLYPEMFANIFLLENRNYDYTASALSVFPKSLKTLYIRLAQRSDTDFGGDNSPRKPSSMFDLINQSPNLKSAFWLSLAIFGVSVLFGFKFAQRLVPIIAPTTNKSMELAKTIGDLYYFNKNNTDLAQKKILYWQEHVRSKLLIPTNKMEKEFWQLVAKKSGADQSILKVIEQSIIHIRNGKKISDQDLVHLSNSIDKFYKS